MVKPNRTREALGFSISADSSQDPRARKRVPEACQGHGLSTRREGRFPVPIRSVQGKFVLRKGAMARNLISDGGIAEGFGEFHSMPSVKAEARWVEVPCPNERVLPTVVHDIEPTSRPGTEKRGDLVDAEQVIDEV